MSVDAYADELRSVAEGRGMSMSPGRRGSVGRDVVARWWTGS